MLPSQELRLNWVMGPSGSLVHVPGTTNGSRTSETGGQISEKIFRRPFLGVSPKISPFPPQNSIYLFKISDDFFLVIDLFVFYIWYFSMGGQIRSRHR